MTLSTPDIEKLRELASEMLAALTALYEACERRANKEGGDFGDDIGPAAELSDAAIAKAALLDSLPSPVSVPEGDAREIARRINGQIFIVEDEERIEAITAAILSARREGIEKAAAWHDPRVEWETARDNPLAANFHRQAAAAIRSLSSPEEG